MGDDKENLNWLQTILDLPRPIIPWLTLIAAIASLIIAFRNDYKLYVVILASTLTLIVLFSLLYIVQARSRPVFGKIGLHRFEERYRISAIIGIGIIVCLIPTILLIEPSRNYVVAALAGVDSTTAANIPTATIPLTTTSISTIRSIETSAPAPTNTLSPLPTNISSSLFSATPSPTLDIYVSLGDCDTTPTPCSYRVREGDYPFLIAEKFYKSRSFAVVIINYNRTEDGNYPNLQRGMKLFIPDVARLPELKFPNCRKGIIPPCLYKAYSGDTFDIVAQDFYGNTKASSAISEANKEYSPINDQLIPRKIGDGTILVLPRWYP